jgi:glycine/D-amino acid oxidase-like deaminating enzyme
MTLYHAAMYDDAQPAGSYWEATVGERGDGDGYAPLTSSESCDVAVIGGGYTGLSTALHLARDYGADVRLLEAGPIGWGASGRNGGFCTLAATKLSVGALIRRYGLDETKRFYATQLEAIDLVDTLARDEGIDYDRQGDGNLLVAHKPGCYRELEEEADTLAIFGITTRLYSRQQFAREGHDGSEQFGALYMRAGFALHPLKFAIGLGRAAARRGAVLHPHSRVLEWRRDAGTHRLVTAGGELRARRVVVATNGFTRDDLHPAFDGVLLPAISNVVTTRPLTEEELARQSWHTENPICNTRHLLFYYRLLPDRSFLFGARGDTTGRPADAQKMRAWMVRRLGEVFPGWKNIPITHFWRGLVCGTRRLTPCVGRLDDEPSVWFALGYHGNGVNSAPWAGMTLARHLAGSNTERPAVPAVMAGLAPRFPLPALRLWVLRGAYLYDRWQDAR